MSALSITIITIAAAIHAYWNMLAKRAIDVKLFAWLSCTTASIVYAPLALYVLSSQQHSFSPTIYGALFIMILVHFLGFTFILKGYKYGDYSIMYPVTRGTGPLIATLSAIVFLGERPSLLSLGGISLIVVGIFILSGSKALKSTKALKPIAFGIMTGCLVAAATVWSKFCVSNLGIHFVLVDYVSSLGLAFILTPYVLSKRQELADEWNKNKFHAPLVGILRTLAFMSVLFVLTTTPVYYVAPLREMSILFAAIIGAKLLKEGQIRRRLAAACVMFGGLVSLSIS